MADPNAVQDPAQDAATPDVSVSSPAPEDSKEEPKQESQPQVESDDNQDVDPGDADLSVEELKKKYSESSKEARLRKEEAELANSRAEQESQKLRELQEDFLSVITESRETFQKYLDNKGFSPAEKEQWLGYYDTQIAKGEQPAAPSQQPQPQFQGQQATVPSQVPSTPMDRIRRMWMSEKDQEMARKVRERDDATQAFLADPRNKELDKVTLNAIWSQAEYFDVKKGLKPKEALEAARRVVVEAESIKDEGYVEAVRDSYTPGVSKGVSGGGGSKGSAFKLSKKDQAFVETEIANEGLTGQAAEDFRRAYALRVQQAKE